MDIPPGAGDRADEYHGGAEAAARWLVAEIERRDGERVGQSVRRTPAERGGYLWPAGVEGHGYEVLLAFLQADEHPSTLDQDVSDPGRLPSDQGMQLP